jgi:cytochrome b involved in lipid metabolism
MSNSAGFQNRKPYPSEHRRVAVDGGFIFLHIHICYTTYHMNIKTHTTEIIIGIIFLLAMGVLVYNTKKPYTVPTETVIPQATTTVTTATTTQATTSQPVSSQPIVSPTPAGITFAQVAIHNSETSCWSVVNGNVYDLTSWIPNHPGGKKRIIAMCGTDGSAAYNGAHGSDSKPPMILAGFKLGVLAK